MQTHSLKIHRQPYEDIATGIKTSELRDCTDRDFQVGDNVELTMVENDGTATRPARSIVRKITHIQHGYGLREGLCVLSYMPFENALIARIAELESRLEQMTHERDTLREVLVLLKPDIKAMAILYQARGEHIRAQALMGIVEGIGE